MSRVDEAVVKLDLDGGCVRVPLTSLTVDQLLAGKPVRKPPSYKGQRNIPGEYWSVTDRAHVQCESRLEFTRARLADFDPRVIGIRAQPFLLEGPEERGHVRHHPPDFALVHKDRSVRIVNVKPAKDLEDPEIRALLGWAHGLLEERGYDTEIWSGDDPVVLENVRLLAGYRNTDLFDEEDVLVATQSLTGCCRFAEAEARLAAVGIARPRPLLMHLLWHHRLHFDLRVVIDVDTILEAR